MGESELSSNSSSSEEDTSTSAIPSAMPLQDEEEDIDVELLEVSQQNLEVVRVNDTRWSNKAKFENAWLLMGLLSIAIMMCVVGAYRQWSSRKQYKDIGEKVSTAVTYGTSNV